MSIVDLLCNSAERLPSNKAIHFGNQFITYSELQEKVFQVAAGLKNIGVKEGVQVSLMMTNRPEYIVSYFAILANGATVVPINPTFKEQEITYIVNDSESQFLLMESIVKPVINQAKSGFKQVQQIFCLGSEDEEYVSWEALVSPSPISMPQQVAASSVAQIIYTSGTTGSPKGAMITHANLNWMTISAAVLNKLTTEDRILCVLPLFHAYAKLQGFLAPIAHGSTIYLEERFHPVETLKVITEHKITVFLGVPTMYAMFAQHPKLDEMDFSQLRVAGCGGASLPEQLLHKTNQSFGVDISEGYGLTESTVMLMTTPRDWPKKVGSVGAAIPGVDLKIVDGDGNECPPHMVGEVIFTGPNMMKGYFKKPEETANTIKDGWLYTGDLAYYDEDGYHFIVDRKKDLVIRGGFNIYPREIEEVVYKHPDVVEASVIGRPDPVFGEKTVAYIVSKNPDLTAEEIRSYCSERLAEYKVPDYVSFLSEIPKNRTGKILKTALKALDQQTSSQ